MCGIFGYIGKQDKAAQIVLEGLKRLEYRGYDSWGIAIKDDETKVGQQKLLVEKHVGKIGNATTSLPGSTLGIGHTRWATHGGVTDANAHPHLDCHEQLAVVHNGIVENNAELKQELIKKNHKFLSETDTEVISHLIEENLKSTPDFAEAVRLTFLKLHGLNAIVAISAVHSVIVTIKNGSPLILGEGDGEFFAASDAAAIIPHTRRVVFLEDDQMAIIGNELSIHESATGKKIGTEYHTLDWKIEDTEKGKYQHFVLKEINEQPHMLENSALSYKTQAQKLADLIRTSRGTFVLGCGTASYAALAGTYLFSKIASEHVNFSIASEFEYLEDYITEETLLIPISQSGETIDVVDPVNKAKKKNAQIAAITNVLGSTLYRNADYKFLLNSGPEKAVVSTKAFTAMYAFLLLTAYALAKRADEGQEILLKTAENCKEILKDTEKIKKCAKALKDAEHIFTIGRGLSYATALEAALKLKETACVHAEGFAGGELKHGSIALIEKGTPVIVFAPNDETYESIVSNATETKSRGAFIIGIGPKNSATFDIFLETGDLREGTFIPQVLIIQLLSYYLALEKGIKDPDKPRNLAKSVTVK